MIKAGYFSECHTAEDLKKEYKRLARALHPDCNPGRDTTKEFQEMQREFERAFDHLKSVHVNAEGEQYTKETTETATEYMEMIEKLMKMSGVIVELCGAWLWCTGNTKEHKDDLKALGFKWSQNKQAWSYHRDPWRKCSRRKYSLDEIRARYGSMHFKSTSETAGDSDRDNGGKSFARGAIQ